MNGNLINIIYHSIVVLILQFNALIQTLYKLAVPYKYRAKCVKGELVLITGAGSGIGRLMAKRFAKLGSRLVLVDIDQKGNEQTAKEILAENNADVKIFKCDLSKRDEIYKVAEEVFYLFIKLILF